MPSGRFAPSPTGQLHLGNLRTALLAWLFARRENSPLFLRFDDLDAAAVRPEHYHTQQNDLKTLGLDWDGNAVHQRDRLVRYRDVLEGLITDDRVYHCYCSRREIRDAAQAPNGPLAGHHYPGTCRELGPDERAARIATGRASALRLRTEAETVGFDDVVAGPVSYQIDDFVVQRNDGTPAYHLVTVVDDADMGIELVVRADDLLDSTSRQLHLARLLDLPEVAHAHVPLVLGADGKRLAKRHRAITLTQRLEAGASPAQVLSLLAASLDLCEVDEPVSPADLLDRFDPSRLPTAPFVLDDY